MLHLPWEDVAALGQEAGRLAAQMQRPVTLDEAVSHRPAARPGRPSRRATPGRRGAPRRRRCPSGEAAGDARVAERVGIGAGAA